MSGNLLFEALTNTIEVVEKETEKEIIGADDTYEVIRIHEAPRTNKWAYVDLRCKSLIGKEQFWQIGFDPLESKLIIWTGYTDGSIRTIDRDVNENLSGRNIQAQALQEARHRYIMMTRKGYIPPGSTNVPMFKIMRADEYHHNRKINFPATIEPKLDGIRIWLSVEHGMVVGKSRGNVLFTTMSHLFSEASMFFMYLPLGSALDCEMFNPLFSLQELTSITRREKTLHPLLSLLELHVFDLYLPENPPYEERRLILEKALMIYRYDMFGYTNSNYLQVGGRHLEIADLRQPQEIIELKLDTKERYLEHAIPKGKTKIFLTERYLVHSHEEITKFHRYFTSVGYEGSMIKRQANGAEFGTTNYKMSQYIFGKGARILKYKDWLDDEAICVGVIDSEGTEKGCAILRLKKNDKEFTVRMKGSLERRREWLRNPSLVLGKPVTYKYQVLTDDGNPRHPVGIEIRDYEPGYQDEFKSN